MRELVRRRYENIRVHRGLTRIKHQQTEKTPLADNDDMTALKKNVEKSIAGG